MEETKEEYSGISVAAPSGWGARHTVTMLCFIGSAVSYAIRFNLSLAIVAMVNRTHTLNITSNLHSSISLSNLTMSSAPEFSYNTPCPNLIETLNDHSLKDQDRSNENNVLSSEGEFNWDEAEQGVILGSFFWGYIITQLPGGMLAKRFGGKWPYGIGLLIAGIFTILTPWAARTDKRLLIFARVMEGMASGVHIPAQTTLISQWAPPNERSLVSTFSFGGMFVGSALTMIVSGYLIHGNVLGGWPSVFYAVGLFSISWFCIWSLVIANSPSEHPGISAEEKNYIEQSIGSTKSKKGDQMENRTPWKHVLTSIPVWTTLLSHIAQAWGLYTLLTETPTYMKTVLNFNITTNSWLSAVPYLSSWIIGIAFAQVSDVLLRRNKVQIVTVRKTAQIIAHGGGALALIGCAYSGCNQILTVSFLILAVGLLGIANSGFIINYVDLAPNHAGVIVGAANTVVNFCGIGAPFVAGLLINNNPSLENWKYVFLIAATILLVGCFTFAIFAAGTEQPWNNLHHFAADYTVKDEVRMRPEILSESVAGIEIEFADEKYIGNDDNKYDEFKESENGIKIPLKNKNS